MSLALHYWMRGAHHCSAPPPDSEMTYTVSSGTLNSSILYYWSDTGSVTLIRDPSQPDHRWSGDLKTRFPHCFSLYTVTASSAQNTNSFQASNYEQPCRRICWSANWLLERREYYAVVNPTTQSDDTCNRSSITMNITTTITTTTITTPTTITITTITISTTTTTITTTIIS